MNSVLALLEVEVALARSQSRFRPQAHQLLRDVVLPMKPTVAVEVVGLLNEVAVLALRQALHLKFGPLHRAQLHHSVFALAPVRALTQLLTQALTHIVNELLDLVRGLLPVLVRAKLLHVEVGLCNQVGQLQLEPQIKRSRLTHASLVVLTLLFDAHCVVYYQAATNARLCFSSLVTPVSTSRPAWTIGLWFPETTAGGADSGHVVARPHKVTSKVFLQRRGDSAD